MRTQGRRGKRPELVGWGSKATEVRAQSCRGEGLELQGCWRQHWEAWIPSAMACCSQELHPFVCKGKLHSASWNGVRKKAGTGRTVHHLGALASRVARKTWNSKLALKRDMGQLEAKKKKK